VETADDRPNRFAVVAVIDAAAALAGKSSAWFDVWNLDGDFVAGSGGLDRSFYSSVAMPALWQAF
jgi:hypothetical protein